MKQTSVCDTTVVTDKSDGIAVVAVIISWYCILTLIPRAQLSASLLRTTVLSESIVSE